MSGNIAPNISGAHVIDADAEGHVMAGLLKASWMTSRLVPDAHLAAREIEHGLTLHPSDGDFGKFADLKWENL